jgi:cubilin
MSARRTMEAAAHRRGSIASTREARAGEIILKLSFCCCSCLLTFFTGECSRCGQCPLGYEGDGRICMPRQSSGSNQCADSSICNANAVCVQYPNSAPLCTCRYGFAGSGYGDNGCVQVAADPCNALLCRNGGTCVRNGTTAYCSCPAGTNPPLCDRTRNGCDPNPCRNGGNCTNMRFGIGFRCTCARGFIGMRCENQQTTCGGVLATENGTLRFPTDPTASTYQHNSRCAWLIRTNATQVLNITFTSFNIEFSSECRYDWLQVSLNFIFC